MRISANLWQINDLHIKMAQEERPAAKPCLLRTYRCRYDYGDDVERVRCTRPGRLVWFRSLA